MSRWKSEARSTAGPAHPRGLASSSRGPPDLCPLRVRFCPSEAPPCRQVSGRFSGPGAGPVPGAGPSGGVSATLAPAVSARRAGAAASAGGAVRQARHGAGSAAGTAMPAAARATARAACVRSTGAAPLAARLARLHAVSPSGAAGHYELPVAATRGATVAEGEYSEPRAVGGGRRGD